MTTRLRRGPWYELGLFGVAAVLMFFYEYLDGVARQEAIDPLVTLIEEGTGVMHAGLLFFLVRRLARWRPVIAETWPRTLPLHALALGVFSVTHTSMNWLTRELLFRAAGLGDYDYGVMPVRYAMELPIDIIVYTAMVVGTWTVDRRDAVVRRVVDQERLEARLAQAQLQNLQLRLQPHFLFNALNTISSVMYDDPVAADTMVARLSELLRRALATADRQEVPLGVELDLLGHYLALLEARFGDDFVCTCTVDPAAAVALVPSLLLQPLVENAVRHGSLARSGRGRVVVRIARVADRLVVQVDDDGPGVPAGRHALNAGTGLGATAERLRLLYGDAHAFEAGNQDGGGFRVTVRLPWRAAAAVEEGWQPGLADGVSPAALEMAHARAHRR
jgi:signal transduction histidine kinase